MMICSEVNDKLSQIDRRYATLYTAVVPVVPGRYVVTKRGVISRAIIPGMVHTSDPTEALPICP